MMKLRFQNIAQRRCLCAELPIYSTSNIIKTLYKIMAKHFQHFKTKQGYFSVWKEVFSYLETERFVPIIGDIKSRKKYWNRRVWLRREFEQFCPLFLRCQEPKEMSALDKCF